MRKYPLLLILGIFFLSQETACHKQQYQLTGNETDQEAMQKCLKLSEKKHFQEAVECLEIFKNRFPDSTYALDAELKIGDTYFNKKDWLLAAESYALYVRLHPNSDKLDYAYYRAGLAYEKQMPKSIDRDQSSLENAEENFASVFRRFPDSPYGKLAQAKYDEIRARGARKNMYVANFYYKFGEYRAAIPRYLTVLQDYPGLGFEETSLYHLALSYHKLGDKEKAQGAAQLMQENYPNSKLTKKIVRKILGGSHG
jgi:outer membrane protein assembly factor BamD